MNDSDRLSDSEYDPNEEVEEIEQPEKIKIVTKKKFNFKDYYQTHPEFRERHLMKLKEKVACACGRNVAKCGLARHYRTKAHLNTITKKDEVEKKNNNELDELRMEVQQLKKLLEQVNTK